MFCFFIFYSLRTYRFLVCVSCSRFPRIIYVYIIFFAIAIHVCHGNLIIFDRQNMIFEKQILFAQFAPLANRGRCAHCDNPGEPYQYPILHIPYTTSRVSRSFQLFVSDMSLQLPSHLCTYAFLCASEYLCSPGCLYPAC